MAGPAHGWRKSKSPAGTADRGNMWMKNGERCYTRWLPKDHASAGKPLLHNLARPFCKQTK
jgi:hypothetical protein